MPKPSDQAIHLHIRKILTLLPNASTEDIKRRLAHVGIQDRELCSHLIPFYEQGLIDDKRQIDWHIQVALKKKQGFNLIARTLSQGAYNPLQVSQALLLLQKSLDHQEQARLCKIDRFGHKPILEPDARSKMTIYLQKQGHRLPDIQKVNKTNHSQK